MLSPTDDPDLIDFEVIDFRPLATVTFDDRVSKLEDELRCSRRVSIYLSFENEPQTNDIYIGAFKGYRIAEKSRRRKGSIY